MALDREPSYPEATDPSHSGTVARTGQPEHPHPVSTGLTVPSSGPVRAEDLEVTLAIRRDLGAEHDEAVIHEFLDRVGAAIDARVDARLAERAPAPPPARSRRASVGLAVTSLLLGTGITGITLGATHGDVGGVIATIAVWAAIALLNLTVAHR